MLPVWKLGSDARATIGESFTSRRGKTGALRKWGMTASPDNKQLLFWCWNAGSNDSTGYEVMPLSGGTPKHVFTSFAVRSWGAYLFDGSFIARVWESSDGVPLTKVTRDGRADRIGTIPYVPAKLSHSADYKRATNGWREAHNDAFMYKVVRQ